MVFSSIIFVFYFLPAFLAFYYLTGARNAALLTGSILFYTWGEGRYMLLLSVLVGLNYWGARSIENAALERRWWWLAAFVTLDLAVLGVFKYAGFLLSNLGNLTGWPLPKVDLALPLGISFFTFQLVSYLIDVGRGKVPAERSPIRLATYIMMFPHLVAGPIVRYADIAEELKHRRLNAEKIGLGVQYFIIGLSQKVLIANAVAPVADYAFSLTALDLDGFTAWVGAVAYTLQIYFDFCGYSNMAIGLAFLLGFHFPKNFDYPYAATSIADFWRRWHISLSSWFRDYVYIPLGGNRHGTAQTLRNLLIVFLLTGLWHGAAWTFIIWGLFHGAFLVLERLWLADRLRRAPELVARVYTLLVVIVGWVFFRAENIGQAKMFLRAMIGLGKARESQPLILWLTPESVTLLIVGAVLSLPVLPWLLDRLASGAVPRTLRAVPAQHNSEAVHALPVPLLVLGFAASLALLTTGTLNPFLYFRF